MVITVAPVVAVALTTQEPLLMERKGRVILRTLLQPVVMAHLPLQGKGMMVLMALLVVVVVGVDLLRLVNRGLMFYLEVVATEATERLPL
jgi:hypothetical protein